MIMGMEEQAGQEILERLRHRSSEHASSGCEACLPAIQAAPSCVGMCVYDVSDDDTFGKQALDPQIHLLQVG